MRRCLVLFVLCALPIAAQTTAPAPKPSIPGQPAAPELSPGSALQYALAPYRDARDQPNDLTAEDKWALGISITRAIKLCNQLTAKGLPKAGSELLDLGRLCNFGVQYQPARDALVAYLGLPHPPDREAAYLLLGRVFLGLHQSAAAESEAESLMDGYPYSTATNALIDEIISHTEGQASGLMPDDTVNRLVEEQLPFLLKALQAGPSSTPPAKDKDAEHAPVDPATAFADALRCAYQFLIEGKPRKEADLIGELAQTLHASQYAHSPELAAMQADLAAYQTMGQPAALDTLRGERVASGHPLIAATVPLMHRVTVLIPVTLWAPTSLTAVQYAAKNFHGTPVSLVAVTSYAVNTGDTDKPSAPILKAFEEMQKEFPPAARLLLLPDRELQQFPLADSPSAILIGPDGIIDYNHPLLTNGDLRLLIEAYQRAQRKGMT